MAKSGLIPAHAGSTRTSHLWMRACGAHPRSRGEHQRARAVAHRPVGSSPLTRGAHGGTFSLGGWRGLIPAHAGSTQRLTWWSCGSPAHPRSRGEHRLVPVGSARFLGSSPLTRGAQLCDRHNTPPPGLIPAHAGSTSPPWRRCLPSRAHPRSRGEHNLGFCFELRDSGSSPLTRGARSVSGRGLHVFGLIPAHAGSTRSLWWRKCQRWAHPRSRGEHCSNSARRSRSAGSSPLTRGAPGGRSARGCSRGLIPAHAGSTG